MKTIQQKGFSLIEVMLAVAIFSVFVTGIIGAIGYGRESTSLAGVRSGAVFLAEEGLEATRNIRDASFANLVNGTYGLTTSSNQWALSGSSDTSGVYTRQITISSIDTNTKQIVSTVTWQQNLQRAGSIALTTYLTNQTPVTAASTLTLNILSANLSTDKKTLQGITLQNTSASPVTVSKIAIGWTPNLLARKTTALTLAGTTVWSSTGPGTPTGAQSSGATVTISPYTIVAGGTATFTAVFNGTNSTNTFTIVFTMSDGSTQTVVTGVII